MKGLSLRHAKITLLLGLMCLRSLVFAQQSHTTESQWLEEILGQYPIADDTLIAAKLKDSTYDSLSIGTYCLGDLYGCRLAIDLQTKGCKVTTGEPFRNNTERIRLAPNVHMVLDEMDANCETFNGFSSWGRTKYYSMMRARKNGPAAVLDTRNQLRVICSFKEDKLHGPVLCYDQNGKLRFVATYCDGLLDKQLIFFNRRGKRIGALEYQSGKLLSKNVPRRIQKGLLKKDGLFAPDFDFPEMKKILPRSLPVWPEDCAGFYGAV